MRGPDALAEPEVETALGIDAKQREQLEDAHRQQIRQYPFDHGQIVGGLSIDEARKKVTELAAERQRKIDEILTPQQKAKLG